MIWRAVLRQAGVVAAGFFFATVLFLAPSVSRAQLATSGPVSVLSVTKPPTVSSALRAASSQLGLLPELSMRRVLAGRLGRLAVYGALFIAIGAIGISVIAVPRLRYAKLDAQDAFPTMVDGMALTVGVVAGFLLVMATLLRTILQFTDSHEMDNSLSIARFIADPLLGRGLFISNVLAALVAVSAAMARRYRESIWWRSSQGAAVVLFIFFWTSSGHTAAARTFLGLPADAVLVTHVIAAGIWVGSLAVIFVTVLPLSLSDTGRLPLLRATVWSFSGMALVSAAVMALTGLLNATAQMDSFDDLMGSRYGRTLLIKLTFVAMLCLVGAYNWRVVTPRLHDIAGALRLRATIRLELLLAAFVLVVTSALVATIPAR